MAGQNISHEGHRQRMRARVEQYGLESLAPHEALEYLLYITNARRDTNGIAHALLERFGSFAGVLEASEEELCRVPGVGPASARMLHLLPEVSRYYEHSRTSTEGALTTTERLAAYLPTLAKMRVTLSSPTRWVSNGFNPCSPSMMTTSSPLMAISFS